MQKNIAILVLAAVVCVEGLAIYGQSKTAKPVDHYFAVGPGLEVIPLKAEQRLELNDAQVTTWYAKHIEEIFTYSFADYATHFQRESTRSMTLEAVADLDAQLNTAGVKRAVTELNLTSVANATGAPIVTQKGNIKGARAWEVTLDGVINYAGPTKTSGQPVTWTALVMEMPQLEGKLRITKIQMKNRQIQGGGN